MPSLNRILDEIKTRFNQSWFGLFFRSTDLGKLMRQTQLPDVWQFYRTYLNSWWWNRLWFRSQIKSDQNLCIFDYDLKCLTYLKENGCLSQDNFNAVVFSTEYDLKQILFYLHKAGILTQRAFDLVINHRRASDLSFALYSLRMGGLLTQTYFELVVTSVNPREMVDALDWLAYEGTLNQLNLVLLTTHVYPTELALGLSSLQKAGILTPENQTALATSRYAIPIAKMIRNTIPAHLLTQENFERLLTAARHANSLADVQRIVDQIIGVDVMINVQAVPPAPAYNSAQSTHTASVHRLVSESAIKLQNSYGLSFNLEEKINELKVYVNRLADTPKHHAAKTCIKRITRANYTFTDSSGVSILQLLALAYVAIHDEVKRKDDSGTKVSLDDAKALFLEGLYEIQRGYNLDDVGNDMGGEDRPICLAGTFNKLMEKLNGIHQDVSVYYITHSGASSKFPKLAKAHASSYLQSIASPETACDYQNVKKLLDSLKNNKTLEPIWDNIKSGIDQALWEEFSEAYNHHRHDKRFEALIAYGHQCGLPNLDEIEIKLNASSGYQAYIIAQAQVGRQANSLWIHQPQTQESQQDLDETLVIERYI